MGIKGHRVAIAGGSIAGCAAAIALKRAGCEVSVYERSASHLEDRGSGIAIPGPLRDELIAADYLPADYANCTYAGRQWIWHDGSQEGRVLWRQPGPLVTNNWSMLWSALRARVDDRDYYDGRAVASFRDHGTSVTVTLDNGETREVDLLIGADGYRSQVRNALQPTARQYFAGYILWRGNYPQSRISGDLIDRALADAAWHTVVFPQGHGIFYMIPNPQRDDDPSLLRMNWAVYTATPPGLSFEEPHAIPPGGVDPGLYAYFDRIVAEHVPPAFADLVRLSPRPEVTIQPIYDETVDRYAAGRVMLIGDAGAITRPHTGSGATKALQDALALEKLATEHAGWDDILSAYDAARTEAGDRLAEMGRRIGHAQVEQTPDWPSMTPDDFETWTRATLAGEKLYFYGSDERRAG